MLRVGLGFAIASCLALAFLGEIAGAQDVQFDRDIRPLLAKNCYHCHGPDENTRESELRLDVEAGL